MHDGLLIEPADALGASDAVTFYQEFQRQESPFFVYCVLMAE
jgi:hypothetical protein